MKRIDVTPQARRDLRAIAQYISRDEPEAADRLADRIDVVLDAISENPKLGRKRTDLAANLRSLPEGRYLIFYREHQDHIAVVRVLHGARNLRRIWRVKD